MKKTLSCESLQGAVYFAPDMLRHCCKRFFRKNKMQGDVEIFKVSTSKDITYERIVEHKKRLYDDINSGKETLCRGCPWLVLDVWDPIEKMKIKHISFEVHSVCNMRCVYCSETYYGGKQPKYDIRRVIKDLVSKGGISEDVAIVWGGGEPTLLKNFNDIFPDTVRLLKPKMNYVFTNVTVYNDVIAECLKEKAGTIVVSIDAGTPQIFKKIRGIDAFEKVFKNLKRYAMIEGQNIIIKYILMEENSSKEELFKFVENVERYHLEKCSFQISADYKIDGISDQATQAAFFLYKQLKGRGISLINFDYHLEPRIKQMCACDNKITESSIIWGAGEYARTLIQTDKFFKQNKIDFFVDRSVEKQGKDFLGYEVKSPEAILKEHKSKLFIASALFFKEIYEELVNEMRISPERIIDNPVL